MARNQFKWMWLHTPTYAAYKVEGTCVPLLLAAGAATKSARSAILVLRSLTPNAQSVFRVLGEFQISHPDDQGRDDFDWLLVPCVRTSNLLALCRSNSSD
jgi:origin recognition complex subunit 2